MVPDGSGRSTDIAVDARGKVICRWLTGRIPGMTVMWCKPALKDADKVAPPLSRTQDLTPLPGSLRQSFCPHDWAQNARRQRGLTTGAVMLTPARALGETGGRATNRPAAATFC